MSAGVIIPGISITLILMILGIYDAYLISISTFYLPFLIPLGIGLIIGSFIKENDKNKKDVKKLKKINK